ncbi:MAG: hypothetical protein FWE08_01605 [Oscillospiraceae bacterium]|nr:hypothetical protein [Oscillospiraceae bacterium]
MANLIRTWILGLTAAAFLAAVAMTLTPKGRPRAVVGLVTGLVTIAALIAPILDFDYEAYARNVEHFELSLEARNAEWEAHQEELTSRIIIERSEAYIWDKAESLGLVGMDIEVAVAHNEAGWMFPDRVWITGEYTTAQQSALSEFLAGTFGIPAERQYWSNADE